MKIPEPDFTFDSITEITPSWLKEHGFTAVLMDIDGTLLPKKAEVLPYDVGKWLLSMKKEGLKLGVVSNNSKRRIGDIEFTLDVPFVAKAHKPSGLGIKHMIREFGLYPDQTIYVGDKKKDIIAARCAGIKSVKVKTMKKGEST